MLVCSSAPRQQCGKHHLCHQQPQRELHRKHCSHCPVKISIHSIVAMEALETTSTAGEVDPDLISKFRARQCTQDRRAQPAQTTAEVGADFRSM
jgi:hypothetical protein